ncbi:MAG: cobalamin-dependent protein [Dehalococcoidia bacterium]|nr:cobalamin-dependent protein [Dehalococcoidia bacterium]
MVGQRYLARGIPAEHVSESLEYLSDFFLAHLPAADGAVVAGALNSVNGKFQQSGDAKTRIGKASTVWPEAEAFEAALLAGNQTDAQAIVTTLLESGKSLVEIELHVMQAALYHIGDLWQENQVSVAQEHMASAMVQSIMTIALVRSTPPPSTGQRVLLACVEGNNHAIGLRMVSDAFQLRGWDVQYLGANVPTSALTQQIEEWRPGLVGLSVAFAQHLPAARATISLLEARFGDARPAVIVGGLAMNRFSQLADFVGANACYADAPSALEHANEFLRA